MRKSIILFVALFTSLCSHAQIGYQVSLLDAAIGQPRADETVSVRIDLTDTTGATICSETKSATSDEFGVLSLTIGNASTFNDVDWSKLPFFISATVDGILLGKSQVLSVPVAEYAKRTGTLTKEILKSKTWRWISGDTVYSLSFGDSTATLSITDTGIHEGTYHYKYIISGDFVTCYGGPNYHNCMELFYTGESLCSCGCEYK